MTVEFWTRSRSLPISARDAAIRAEHDGWDGMTFTDSQNLSGDPYVALAVAAEATHRLRLGTGVTNPVTRHPAVTASAISCINAVSGGRAELGFGRGDSSLAHLGLPPADIATFRERLSQIMTYLRGGGVSLDRAALSDRRIDPSLLPAGALPNESRIEWLDEYSAEGVPVPVFVVGSGPRVFRVGAELADRVALAVGADAERVAWAIDIARTARPDIPLSAYVTVVVHDDVEQARELASGTIASLARFSVMHGSVAGPIDANQLSVLNGISKSYNMANHFGRGAQSAAVTSEFAERYAILGPPTKCRERLLELIDLGVDRFHIMQVSRDVETDLSQRINRRLIDEVIASIK